MRTSGQSKHFFENLDALRFFSFFGVFLSHAFFTGTRDLAEGGFLNGIGRFSHLGRLGVDFFFVLSSFLITWIILEEFRSTLKFKIGYFFLRRILRIWPLYFLLVLIGMLLVTVQYAVGVTPSTLPPLIYLFTFTLNFYITQLGPHFLFFLVFLWSISVEEQFYLCWAFFLKFFRRHLSLFCWMLIATSMIFRWICFPDSNKLYFHTLSVVCDFGMGALIAKTAFDKSDLLNRVRLAARSYWIALYAILLFSLVFYDRLFETRIMVSIERSWFALLFALIILEQSYAERSWVKFGRWPAINYLGRISYGLYCYHGLMLTLAAKWVASSYVPEGILLKIVLPVVLFLFTTLAASTSYRFFERPFLRMKEKYY